MKGVCLYACQPRFSAWDKGSTGGSALRPEFRAQLQCLGTVRLRRLMGPLGTSALSSEVCVYERETDRKGKREDPPLTLPLNIHPYTYDVASRDGSYDNTESRCGDQSGGRCCFGQHREGSVR